MNNSIRRRLFCVTVALAFVSMTNAMANGSAYSRFGIGDRTLFGGSRLYAMANTGLSLHGDGFINLLNPAGLAGITETRITGGFEYQNFSSKDNLGSAKYARGEFQGLAFAFPISKAHGISMLLEATPYSTVRYAVESQGDQLGTTSTQKFYGTGGLTTFSIGGSYSPFKKTIFGLKFNYLFGGINQFNFINFDDPSFTDSELQRYGYHSGSSVTLGGIYHGFADLFNAPSLENLSVGLVFTTPTSLKVREETFRVISTILDTLRIGSRSQEIPTAWGAGISYDFSERYTIAGDVQMQHWKPENFSTQQTVNIRESARFGIGFEARPARGANSFLTAIAYRAGIAYHSSYIKIGNEPIDELLVSGGVGLPIGFGSRMNIGLQVGVRGTTNNNLQQDTIFRLSLSLSASEAWFLTFEEE
ncbi:MAG: hypothetical protein L0Y80_12370 [Ignavibacteriae bacterium]|nr:hypothetical protein [Ignavibacteriota bacterium]